MIPLEPFQRLAGFGQRALSGRCGSGLYSWWTLLGGQKLDHQGAKAQSADGLMLGQPALKPSVINYLPADENQSRRCQPWRFLKSN